MTKLSPFDATDYLDNEETIAEDLNAALEDSNSGVFLASMRDVARTRGMAQLAIDSELGAKACARPCGPWRQTALRQHAETDSCLGAEALRFDGLKR